MFGESWCIFLAKSAQDRWNEVKPRARARRQVVDDRNNHLAFSKFSPGMNERALELFRRACGLAAPLVLECEGPIRSAAASSLRSFECPYILIGRVPKSDLILDDAQVSRRHAILQVIAGKVFVFDLQSRSHVCWEGEDEPRSLGWLDQGQSILVGPYRLRTSGLHSLADPAPDLDGDHSPLVPEPSAS